MEGMITVDREGSAGYATNDKRGGADDHGQGPHRDG